MKAYVHQGIARVIDSFESDLFYYICFEREDFEHSKHLPASARKSSVLFNLLEKMSIKDYIRMLQTKPTVFHQRSENSMSEYEMHIVDVCTKLGQTIAFLHKLGIVMRDLDFSSIFLV